MDTNFVTSFQEFQSNRSVSILTFGKQRYICSLNELALFMEITMTQLFNDLFGVAYLLFSSLLILAKVKVNAN